MPKSFQIGLVLKGIIMAAVIALVLSIIFGIILTFSAISESATSLNIIFGVSVFIGAALTSYQAGTKGLYYGLAIGIGFILLLLIIYTIFNPESPSWIRMGEKAILALLSGAVGGIVGVIFKR